ncbi:MAG: hypothetical protein AAFX09_05825 [Pseudomonadota bacterium]
MRVWIVGAVAGALSAGTSAQSFDGRIAAVADADMVASAYADGRLEPLDAAEGADSVILIEERSGRLVELDRAPASNSVISWPHVIEASANGRTVYVVETRGSMPGIEAVQNVYEDFPAGQTLIAYRVEADRFVEIGQADVGPSPESVSRSPDGRWLIVATRDPEAEVAFVALSEEGAPGRVVRADIDLGGFEQGEDGLNGLIWSPVDDLIAANIANKDLVIYRVERDGNGNPFSLSQTSEALRVGEQWSVGKWTPDGRHYVITDTGWGDARGLSLLIQPRGHLSSVRVHQDGSADIADRLVIGLSPEGFDISPDGALIAAVNMRRTYLPDNPLLALWPGRNRSSLSLVSLDPDTGALQAAGDQVFFEGVLPEDAIFDADGDSLAVATFHLRSGPGRRLGYVDLWRVENTSQGPRAVDLNERLATVRGPHDLVRLAE